MSWNFDNILHQLAIIVLPLLFAITLHEAMHGWVANKLGDKTALMLGRVSLDPAKHIDLFGTIILPILMLILTNFHFTFGWAKPVPITWQNLKKPRRDMALVALAGPLANLAMAFLWAGIAKTASHFTIPELSITDSSIAGFFYDVGIFGIAINMMLGILNLIPIPPLDGSRVLSSLLSPRASYKYEKLEPWGMWILLALLIVFPTILYFPVMIGVNLVRALFGL